jgi:SOS response regulatory protein OraA/RecX
MVRQRIERKLRLFRGPDTGKKFDDKKIASLYRTLLRAGFSSDTIRRELKRATTEEIPEVDPSSESL